MRINREILLKSIRTFVERQVRQDRTLLSVYLCGSCLTDDPLLGGSGDADLVFVHTDEVQVVREIQPLLDQVHLDIQHHYHRNYRQPRRLRLDPWLGPAIQSALVLHDPQHFMDFTQASVRGQFERPDYVLQRARTFLDRARQELVGLPALPLDTLPQVSAAVVHYLDGLYAAINAVTSLSGSPLGWRRVLRDFHARAALVDRPGLHAGVLGLLGAAHLDMSQLTGWVKPWEQAFSQVPAADRPVELHPLRLSYYRSAIESALSGTDPASLIWPLVRTWALAASHLDASSHAMTEWQTAIDQLGLVGQHFHEKLEGLDAFLDTVEETQDAWAARNGA